MVFHSSESKEIFLGKTALKRKMASMKFLVPLFLACALTSAQNILGVLENAIPEFGGGFDEDVSFVKQPLEKAAVGALSSQCEIAKNLIGVSYEDVKEDEPNVDHLELVYITSSDTITFKLSEAAEEIPKTAIFDKTQTLYIYLHGFTDNPTEESFTSLREALFSQGNDNVLALDSSSLIGQFYLRSSTYVRLIGELLGAVLVALEQMGFAADSMHVIGHSLGAHIAGFTGKMFKNLTGGHRVGRISGLDPAGPCFTDVDEDLRLRRTDADFVDVIHTNGGVYGLTDAIGDVDYYPNDGETQPGCVKTTCNHNRVWHLFAESVFNPTGFPAVQCEDWNAFRRGECDYSTISYMGYGSEPGTTGKFYLETNGEEPYARGDDGITFSNSADGVLTSLDNYVVTNSR